jgi:endonuclease/exonuclease/phosphatase family metal-dependent hydrolase
MKSQSNKADNNNAASASRTVDNNDEKTKFDVEKSFSKISKSTESSPQSVLNVSISNTDSNSFRVLTYNLWCHRLVGGRRSAQRLNIFAAWLLNNYTQFYDIICLQEVFVCNPLLLLNYGSGQRTQLIEILKSKYPHSYTADTPWFGVQDSGCLILSAHKIESCHQEPFGNYSLSELITHKGYMCCKITIANKDLIVINTHLNSQMQTSIRARQLEQINDHITTYHTGHRVILCGDLNIVYGGKEYNDMLKSIFMNRLIDSTPNAAATYRRSVRLDYILTDQYFSLTSSAVVSADAKNQNDPKLMVSDHEGLEATLKFTSAEPPNAEIKIILQSNKPRTRQIKGLATFLVTVLAAIIYYYLFQS